jgi:serine/threonine protein phosphatase PrpC
VDGELAVARALGDSKYKSNPHVDRRSQKVIALPDVTHLHASPGDFLLIACDG